MVPGIEMLAAGTLFGTSIFHSASEPQKTLSEYIRSVTILAIATVACFIIATSPTTMDSSVVVSASIALISLLLTTAHEVRCSHLLFAFYLTLLGLVIGLWALLHILQSSPGYFFTN